MSTKEEQDILRSLVQYVARAFYEPKFVVILDQLARHPVLKDDDLAGRMGLQMKELNKLTAVLANDKLIRVYRQNELKEGAQRSIGKQYYYIDHRAFCDVVKWRMAEMRRTIDVGLRNELDNKGYICPQCSKSFTPLEAPKLMDFTMGVFLCDVCHAELVDNENASNVIGSRDRMQRFNHQMRWITSLLRRTEEVTVPAFDVAGWVRKHVAPDAGPGSANGAAGGAGGPELKIAGANGASRQDEGIGVVMSLDRDEETRRAERAREAEARKQQNALPSWHLKSTITGDLTALGIKESARAEAAAAKQAAASSNDEILRGLGTARPNPSHAKNGAQANGPRIDVTKTEDVKPNLDRDDYYDRYYASLAVSNSGTPTTTHPPSDFDDEEEDIKPDVKYLNSLNDYRKRSRSREDEGDARGKLARTADGVGVDFGAAADEDGDDDMEGVPAANGADAVDPADDPPIMVNGQPLPFSRVTEEHQELMTPEEYEAYFEVFSARS